MIDNEKAKEIKERLKCGICDVCPDALQYIEDLEERIAIMTDGELHCPVCGKKLNV